MMENIILGFLMYRPLTMYELKKAMEASTEHFMSASFGSLHPTLNRLEERELVSSTQRTDNGRAKRIFAITKAGRAAFLEWLATDFSTEKVRDPSLLRVFFLGHLPDSERHGLVKRYVQDLQRSEQALQAILKEGRAKEVPAALEQHKTWQLATVEFGIAYYRFAQDWYANALKGKKGPSKWA